MSRVFGFVTGFSQKREWLTEVGTKYDECRLINTPLFMDVSVTTFFGSFPPGTTRYGQRTFPVDPFFSNPVR